MKKYTAQHLLYASSMRYRQDGDEATAKLMRIIHDNRNSGLILKLYEEQLRKKDSSSRECTEFLSHFKQEKSKFLVSGETALQRFVKQEFLACDCYFSAINPWGTKLFKLICKKRP